MRTALARYKWLVAVVVVVALVTALIVHVRSGDDCEGCLRAQGGSTIEAKIAVVGESGEPIKGAKVTLHGIAEAEGVLSTDDRGVATVPVLSGPAVAVIEADGHLTEPISIGWSDSGKEMSVRLFARTPNRFTMHSAGDVMFGRRYADPSQEKSGSRSGALIPADAAAAGAERVVAAVAPMFGATDFSTVNLETVLSDKPAEAAYPGKRFPLNSAPGTVAGLKALSVDLAVLANDHARDLLDAGIADTRHTLGAAGIAMVGAGATADEAAAPHTRELNGSPITVLAYTTVDGSFVNANFPTAKTRKPADLPEKDNWQYEARPWGFAEARIPTAPRRIGDAWEQFRAAEPRLAEDAVGRLWASMTQVYPETQDWVARRGHGGAARWEGTKSEEQIRAASNGVTVVQVHSGLEFQDAEAADTREVARKAIDAGADIVVAHHPNVLQGVEWYKGKLIAYSLGNFVFDQNFLSTFSSAFLRTVWEGDRLLEARLLPVEIVDYVPVPLTDRAAARVLTGVWERGLLTAESYRESVEVRTRAVRPDPDSVFAQIAIERHTGVIQQGDAAEREVKVALGPRETADLGDVVPVTALTKPGAVGGVDIGRDLFGWGHFEDESADNSVSEAAHWSINSNQEGAQPGPTPQGLRYLRMQSHGSDIVQTRTIARVSLPRHRLFEVRRGKPVGVDPVPSYSLTAMVRRATTAAPEVRFEVYHFDDSNPTEDPSTRAVASHVRPIDVPADGAWHRVVIDLTTAELDAGAVQGNTVMPYFRLGSGDGGRAAWVEIDDVRFIEWRAAEGMSGTLAPLTMVRNRADAATELPLFIREPR
ncbi:CapA family protein [Actinokineospora xionganensis]|uniref:CapA family protein n=1 Tax=Actinokineospora xionganensis TaxID=2684470 RepID=A0ABR7L6B0_9PSEU|nr:CapA family protein [Actinokineospora xionganensis]MBC6447877.1 CapA family protein [Actinokineospora xionganensis]